MNLESFFYLQPGERRSCVGCHEPVGTAPDMKKAAKMARMKPMDLKPAAGPQYAGGMSFHRTVQPVLDKHCIKCHGPSKPKGNLRLDMLKWTPTDESNVEVWQAIIDRVEAGEMPPEDAPQPSRLERDAFLKSVRVRITSAAQHSSHQSVLRRLNRVQFRNTL